MRFERGTSPLGANFRGVHRYLILATDTDAGKTFVSAALCAALLKSGLRVAACKPIETGWLTQSDLETIAQMCGRHPALQLASGMRFAQPAAPSAAARAEGRPSPSARDFVQTVRRAEHDADAVVVETCGGAMTPLSATEYVADAASQLRDYRCVLVAGLKLGVLSHAFGACEYLSARRLPAPIVILNDRYGSSAKSYVQSTREDLASRGLHVAAFVPHGASIHDVQLDGLIETG